MKKYESSKAEKIEKYISKITTIYSSGKKTIRYRLNFHNGNLRTSKHFDTLEEAKHWKAIIESQLQQAQMRNVNDALNKLDKLEYPDNLLDALDITPKKYSNYYDEIIPNFDENLKSIIDKSTITDRELTCLNLYYKEYFTLEKVGQYIGCTRERVRQILKKCIAKIKCKKSLLIQGKDKLELISKEERDRMIAELRETMTIDVALEILKKANLDKRKDKAEILKETKDYRGLNESIDVLELSVRSWNCLKRHDIKTVGELLDKRYDDLIKIRNLGRKSLREIIKAVEKNYQYTWNELYPFTKAKPIETKWEEEDEETDY